MSSTVPRLLLARAADTPDRVAIVCGDRTLTFQQWNARSTRVAQALLEHGLSPGDRVALLFGGTDWIDYAVACAGAQKAGCVAVPLSDRLADREVADLLSRCGASGLVHGAAIPPPPTSACWTRPVEALVPSGDRAALPEVMPDHLAQIVFTSGTTGTPKGVGATHANLTHGHVPHPRLRAYAHSTHFVHAFPIGTNAGQMMLLEALTAHPAMAPLPAFQSDAFCDLVERHRAGTVFLVPSMAIELLRSDAPSRYDLSGVLLVSSSAAALPPQVASDLSAAFGSAVLVNHYTSTEAAPAGTTMIFDPARPGSLGRPAAGTLQIRAGDGRIAPPGTVGEVWLRSDAEPRSYFGDRTATAQIFKSGWVRMGDLGHLDASGHLHLVDRESDVIKSGALKVSTVQIEAVLHEHPAVAEAAVVGIPHPTMGSMPVAAVRLAFPVDPDDLRDFLSARLARHELPTSIRFVESLPRNTTGKVVKPRVRELFG